MGTVVTLPTRQASRRSAARTAEATILLFMGVRYVRDRDGDETAEAAAAEPEPDREADLPLELA